MNIYTVCVCACACVISFEIAEMLILWLRHIFVYLCMLSCMANEKIISV